MNSLSVLLIIKDDPLTQELIASFAGFPRKSFVETAANGQKAKKILKTRPVDLILLDMDLDPRSSAVSITLAKEINEKYEIPVIFLTSRPNREDLGETLQAEPYGYLSKNNCKENLFLGIEMVLKRHKDDHVFRMMASTLASMTEIVVTIKEDGEILYYNKRAEELFGWGSYKKYIDENQRRYFTDLPFFTLDGTPFSNIYSVDEISERMCYYRPGKKEFLLESNLSKVFIAKEGGCKKIFVFRDISHNNLVNELESFLHTIVETSDDVVVGLDLKGFVKTWNHGAINFTALQPDDVFGKHISEIFPEVPFPVFSDALAITETEEYFFHSNRYKTAYLLVHLTPLLGTRGKVFGYSVIARDITERTIMEKKIIEAEEKTRFRIARNLHDGLGQQLTGLSFKIKALQAAIKHDHQADADKIAQELSDLTRLAITETRALSRNLMPEILETDGLDEALRNLARHISQTCGLVVNYVSSGVGELNAEEISQFYHIAQEAINNAVKHSGAGEIRISLKKTLKGYELRIKDNGKGFDIKTITKGLGISNMRYRSDIINGELEVKSGTTQGTEIICYLRSSRRYKEKKGESK